MTVCLDTSCCLTTGSQMLTNYIFDLNFHLMPRLWIKLLISASRVPYDKFNHVDFSERIKMSDIAQSQPMPVNHK